MLLKAWYRLVGVAHSHRQAHVHAAATRGHGRVRRRHGRRQLGGLLRRRQGHGVGAEPRHGHRLAVGGPSHRGVMHAHHRAARLGAALTEHGASTGSAQLQSGGCRAAGAERRVQGGGCRAAGAERRVQSGGCRAVGGVAGLVWRLRGGMEVAGLVWRLQGGRRLPTSCAASRSASRERCAKGEASQRTLPRCAPG